MAAGAGGYLTKSSEENEISQAITTIASGGT
jgi:DNA-binding NarL/FixJ family response regulator